MSSSLSCFRDTNPLVLPPFLHNKMAVPSIDAGLDKRSVSFRAGVLSKTRLSVAETLSRIIFSSLLALVIVLPFPYGAVQAWWTALFEVVVLAATILWIVEGLYGGGWFVEEHRVLVPLVLCLFFALAQTIGFSSASISGVTITKAISADVFEERQFTRYFLAHILLLAMLLKFIDSRSRQRTLTYIVIGTGIAIALFGLLRFFFQPQQGGFLLHYLRGGAGFGPYINRNHFSFLMEMTLGLIAGMIIFGELRKRQLKLLLAFAITIWVAVSLSNSRGGTFAIVCQIMLGLFLAISLRRVNTTHRLFNKITRGVSGSLSLKMATLGVILIVIVTGTILIGGETFKTGISMVPAEISGDYEKNSEGRADIWKAGWNLFKAHPIAGSGFGAFSAAVTEYHKKPGIWAIHQAHNDYLEILASGGLIGAALAIWFAFGVYKMSIKRMRNDWGFGLASRWGAIIGLLGVAIHSLVEFGLHVPGNSVALMALLAISMADTSRRMRGRIRV